MKAVIVNKGGKGSGHHGHRGRPGKVGGSLPGSGDASKLTPEQRRKRAAYSYIRRMRRRIRQYKKGKGFTKIDDRIAWLRDTLGLEGVSREELQHKDEMLNNAWNKLLPDSPMNYAEFVQAAWLDHTMEEDGFILDTEQLYATYQGRISFEAAIYIEDELGRWNVGHLDRVIKLDDVPIEEVLMNSNIRYISDMNHVNVPIIRNQTLTITENHRGYGIGSKIYQKQEEVAFGAGIHAITLWANGDVGGYAWARMGYNDYEDLDNRSYNRQQPRFVWFDMWQKHYEKMAAVGAIARIPDGPPDMPKFKQVWDLARTKVRLPGYMGHEPVMHPFGKESLLGMSWDAIKYLDFTSIGWQIGAKYFAAKYVSELVNAGEL